MRRAFFCAALGFAVILSAVARADDKQAKSDSQQKHCMHATITKIGPQKDSISVKLHDKSGKEQEKTFQLGKDVEFRDTSGKTAKLDDFKVGDDVVITEKDGKVCEIKENDEATITNVDPKTGTVTLKMKDKDGKETTKVFKLTEDAEYVDSSGRVATLDVFRAGDQVLVIEGEGRMKGMKKSSGVKGSTASTQKRNDNKSSNK
jgi:uncharacterized protein YigE (DUF2233 family)